MKKWKKILQNCPYLSALLITWFFMTVGSIGLIIYRDYSGPEKSAILSNPLFAIIMEEEMHNIVDNTSTGGVITVNASEQTATAGGQNDDKVTQVTQRVSGSDSISGN
ncbi:MAG: hypothetical protein K2H31_08180, partial [Lachnospiraceae bacterium]|nr:hypothetical protein [Lachnospiraceae bacterium]